LSAKMEKLFSLLSDNEWHEIDHVTSALQVSESKLNQVIGSLAEAGILQHDSRTNQVRLGQTWEAFFAKSMNPDCEKPADDGPYAVGSMIVPPQQSLVIQCTRITNMTDMSLELELRIDRRLREMVINRVR